MISTYRAYRIVCDGSPMPPKTLPHILLLDELALLNMDVFLSFVLKSGIILNLYYS